MDSDVPEKDYNHILGVLQEGNVSILELVNVLLTEKHFKNHAVLIDLLGNAGPLLLLVYWAIDNYRMMLGIKSALSLSAYMRRKFKILFKQMPVGTLVHSKQIPRILRTLLGNL